MEKTIGDVVEKYYRGDIDKFTQVILHLNIYIDSYYSEIIKKIYEYDMQYGLTGYLYCMFNEFFIKEFCSISF